MVSLFSELNTMSLIEIVEKIKEPSTYLVDKIFPRTQQITTDILPIETYKEHRRLAPYVVEGANAANVKRSGSRIRLFQAPLVGVRRVIGINDISRRMIGETPIFSTKTPEDRARELVARDLIELQNMIINRKAQQASELLQKGKITVNGYADDGATPRVDEIDFNWSGERQVTWKVASTDIFKNIMDASEEIQENAGILPTLLICGRNIEGYLIANTKMKEFLLSANANAINVINYQPRYTSPQVRHLGFIPALNLELVSYSETYWDGNAAVPFIDPDSAILCCPGRGRQVFGAVTILENKEWRTYAAQMVPIYRANEDAQTSSVSVFSRFILIPETVDDFICFKVKA